MRKRIGEDFVARNDDEGYTIKWSGEYEVISDHWMPAWVEFETAGHDGPDTYARIELRKGAPRIVHLGWTSKPGQVEIRPRDLRAPYFDFDFLMGLYASLTVRNDRKRKTLELPGVTDRDEPNPQYYAALKFIERQRRPEGHRVITPAFLEAVADVYRRNIDHAPTQAVAKAFDVKSRMASTYVDRARKAGLLPQTKQGQKKA